MTFNSTKSEFIQEHFSIIEIEAPVVNAGFGTPLSSNNTASTGTQTYKFTDYAGVLPESHIWKCLSKVSETPTELQPNKGLAIRGTGTIKLNDFIGDPNPTAPDVTSDVIGQGTFLSKFNARNILVNRPCTIRNFRIINGVVDLTASEDRAYIIDSFDTNGKGVWTVKLKDELSKINFDEAVWPIEQQGYLRQAINDTDLSFYVDFNNVYATGQTVRIGDELIKISAVANIGTASAMIYTASRGAPITYTNTLSFTFASEHDSGDEIYICDVSDDEKINVLLKRILLTADVDASYINDAEWEAEIDEWHTNTMVNTLWLEPMDANEQLERILTAYQLDMWVDNIARQIRLSAISVWKESSSTISEGNEINYNSVKITKNENLRATRALVVYDKGYLVAPDEVENYSKASLFKREELETSDIYGKSKIKHFGFINFIDKNGSDLLVNRWVNRYINPINYSFTMPERKLDLLVGDVVNIKTDNNIGFNGLATENARAQILSVKPKYGRVGREYAVKALSYEPVFGGGGAHVEIVISGNVENINLYTQYAGAPSQAVTITFIVDATVTGNDTSIPSMIAGSFPSGSKIILIFVNANLAQAKGGTGGAGQGGVWIPELNKWNLFAVGDGRGGGTVYDAQGVDTDIYLSGATTSVSYPVADGYIKAPSGGAGGFYGTFDLTDGTGTSGWGGAGGDGDNFGIGGNAGAISEDGTVGANGLDGKTDGTGSGWGQAGLNNNSTGGLAGSGIIDSGATVTLYGSSAARYINGNGDH